MVASTAPHLLLVEFLVPGRLRDESAMYFPYLQGLARAHGLAVKWVCFGARLSRWWDKEEGRTTFVALDPDDRRSLHALCREFQPTHVVTNDLLDSEGQAAIREVVPTVSLLVFPQGLEVFFASNYPSQTEHEMLVHTRLVFASDPAGAAPASQQPVAHARWFASWLGRPDMANPRDYLVEIAVPDYATIPGNAEAKGVKAPLVIVSGAGCKGRPSIRHNPLFAGLDFDGMFLTTGCSFCGGSEVPAPHSARADREALIERQFRRVLETASPEGRRPGLYDVYDLEWFLRIDVFFALVFRLQLPPSTFVFGPRIDDVVAVRDKIEALLPRLSAAGHTIRLEIMGLESFSEHQMRLFNKDISVAMLDDLLDMVETWSRDYPAVFNLLESGMSRRQWSMILFTPWTTLADTRANLVEAARRGFEGNDLWLFSSLMIRQGTPLFVLAASEGDILVEEFEDCGLRYFPLLAIRDLYATVPWRFRDPKVAAMYRVLVRVCAFALDGPDCPFFTRDEEFLEIQPLLEEAQSRWISRRSEGHSLPLRIAECLLDVLETSETPDTSESLLRAALSLALAGIPSVMSAPPGEQEERAATAEDRAPAADRAAPLPPTRPETPVIARLFAALQERPPAPFAHITFGSVAEVSREDSTRLLRLELGLGDRTVWIFLHDTESPAACLFSSKRFRVSYPEATPLVGPEEVEMVKRLVKTIETVLDRRPATRSKAP